MWFVVSSALSVLVYVVLKPLGDGLMDTSAWAAKVKSATGLLNVTLGRINLGHINLERI